MFTGVTAEAPKDEEKCIGFAADELPVHYRGGVGKSEKGRVGRLGT